MMNVLHDIYFNIGFDENINFQNVNYSGLGKGNDPVILINFNNKKSVMSASEYNKLPEYQKAEDQFNTRNYHMGVMAFSTPEDGQPPVLYMSNLKYATYNHGLIHEYTHGVFGRYLQKAHLQNCFGEEGSSINEGNSEFFASSLAFQERRNDWTFGHLWKYKNTNINKSITQNMYHRMEFFAGALNDALFFICGKKNNVKGFKCDENLMQDFKPIKKTNLPYNVLYFQIILDSISLLQCNPTYATWRNAIFTAVNTNMVTRNSKYFKCLLWISFANRGFGYNAVESYTKSYSPGDGILFEQYENNFDIPDECMEYKKILDDNRMYVEDYTYSKAYNYEIRELLYN